MQWCWSVRVLILVNTSSAVRRISLLIIHVYHYSVWITATSHQTICTYSTCSLCSLLSGWAEAAFYNSCCKILPWRDSRTLMQFISLNSTAVLSFQCSFLLSLQVLCRHPSDHLRQWPGDELSSSRTLSCMLPALVFPFCKNKFFFKAKDEHKSFQDLESHHLGGCLTC